MSAQAWADEGLVELYVDLFDFDLPLTPEQARLFLRAAYGRGYYRALTEPEAPITLEVLEYAEELALRVPVS